MKAPNGKVRRMVVEPADNGGFLSRTEREAPKSKSGYYENPDEKNVHPNVEHLAAHIKKTFPPKGGKPSGKKKSAPAPPTAASAIGDQMLDTKC